MESSGPNESEGYDHEVSAMTPLAELLNLELAFAGPNLVGRPFLCTDTVRGAAVKVVLAGARASFRLVARSDRLP